MGVCKKCKLKKGWLKKYIKSLGVDLSTWGDVPATFRETKEEELTTKKNKKWSFLTNVAESTIFIVFIGRFDSILFDARVHVSDGYWQDTTYSMMFEKGTKVPY